MPPKDEKIWESSCDEFRNAGNKVVFCSTCYTDSARVPVSTPTGEICAVVSDTTWCNEMSLDGVVWNGAEVSAETMPTRTSTNLHQIWLAHSSETHAPPHWPRLIGDSNWMLQMNYAAHYGSNTDFPVDRIPGLTTWPTVKRELIESKTQWILYMSSNCATESQRDDFVRRASQYIDISSVGSCFHNTEFPQRLKHLEQDSEGNSLRLTWQDYGPGLRALLATYRFRIVIISTLCHDYWADGEKIYQTLEAGVIPVYLGMPNSHDWDPGVAAGVHPAMIHIQDFDGLQELADHLHALGADTEEARRRRKRYFEYQGKAPVTFPRHADTLREKTGGMHWIEYACAKSHHGDPQRSVRPQDPCSGSWWQLLNVLGKNLTRWGCTDSDPC